MVKPKARISYSYGGDEGSEGSNHGDSEEEVSDAPPPKKQKKSASAKKKVKKAKKAKKSKYTDDSDEDPFAGEVSDDEPAATWRPGGPVVQSKPAPPPKKGGYVYKDASDQDFTDDGEIEDAADSDFEMSAKSPPKKKTPKKTPAKKGKKTKPAKKTTTPAKKKGKAKNASNGTPRASGRSNGKGKIKYADTDEEDEEEEDDYSEEEELPIAKKTKVAKQAKKAGRPPPPPKKPEVPPVAEMVPEAIRGLRDNPRKGSSLAAIKGYMGEEWGINVKDYAPKIKKYILRAVESGDVLQTKGKGASGRFTVPGLKARKRRAKVSGGVALTKKYDEDVVEYEPGKSARDEAREQTDMELAERRAKLVEEAARKLAEKEMKPKKPRPAPKTDWVVTMVKGMKIKGEVTWYQVMSKYI
jgi:histone H1/5